MKSINAAAAAAVLALCGLAASASGQTNPRVAQANNRVAAQAADDAAVRAAGNADVQASYAGDMAAYRRAVTTNHRIAAHDARIYNRQQRAYADAMADWRHQVFACRHGSHRACNAPTPDPANYW